MIETSLRHLVGRPRGNEHVGRIARPVRRGGFRGRRLGDREADLLAAGRSGIGAPVAILAEQRRLDAADGGGVRGFGAAWRPLGAAAAGLGLGSGLLGLAGWRGAGAAEARSRSRGCWASAGTANAAASSKRQNNPPSSMDSHRASRTPPRIHSKPFKFNPIRAREVERDRRPTRRVTAPPWPARTAGKM